MSDELAKLQGKPWGWAIYCTTYTPGSERLFAIAIKIIESYLDYEAHSSFRGRGKEDRYLPYVALLKNVPIDNTSLLDQASFADLRAHFTAWVQMQDDRLNDEGEFDIVSPRWKNFPVVDEKALQSIVDAPKPDAFLDDPVGALRPFVKVAATQHDERATFLPPTHTMRGRGDQSTSPRGQMFPGWMKIPVLELRGLAELRGTQFAGALPPKSLLMILVGITEVDSG